MKVIAPKLRTDAGIAKSVITNVFSGLPPAEMLNYLNFLHASIRFLSSYCNDRWGITLFEYGVSLNAGWSEVLVLRRDGLRVLVEREAAPSGTTFETDHIPLAAGCDFTRVQLSELHRTLPSLSAAHIIAMSFAAEWNIGNDIREAHSTGVIDYLSESLSQPLSNPSYAARAKSAAPSDAHLSRRGL